MVLAAAAAALVVLWAGPAKAGTPIQIGQVAPGIPSAACGTANNLVQASVAGAPSHLLLRSGHAKIARIVKYSLEGPQSHGSRGIRSARLARGVRAA